MFTNDSLMRILSDLISAGLGYFISGRFPVPRKTAHWLIFGLVLIVARNYPIGRHAVFLGEFWLDPTLQGALIGILFGYIIRGKIRYQTDTPAS